MLTSPVPFFFSFCLFAYLWVLILYAQKPGIALSACQLLTTSYLCYLFSICYSSSISPLFICLLPFPSGVSVPAFWLKLWMNQWTNVTRWSLLSSGRTGELVENIYLLGWNSEIKWERWGVSVLYTETQWNLKMTLPFQFKLRFLMAIISFLIQHERSNGFHVIIFS